MQISHSSSQSKPQIPIFHFIQFGSKHPPPLPFLLLIPPPLLYLRQRMIRVPNVSQTQPTNPKEKPSQTMAENLFLFFLLLLFCLSICCSGTVGSSSYGSRSKTDTSSMLKTLSTLVQDKAFPFQFQVLVSDHDVVDRLSTTGGSRSANIYLENSQYGYLRSYRAFWVSGSKTHLRSHIPKLKTPSVIVSCSTCGDFSKGNELQMLVPILRSTKSLLKGIQLEMPARISVALPLSVLSNLNKNQKRHLDDVLDFVTETKSFLIVEDFVDGEWNKADGLIESLISKADLVTSRLSHAHVPIVLSIRSSVFPSATDLAALNREILRSLDNYPTSSVTLTHRLQRSHSSRRELLTNFIYKSIIHDSLFPPTTPVTNPTTPTTFPPYSTTPTIVTIPATNPVPSTTTPVSTTPLTPTTNPVAPVMYPGAQPVTNPVTTYPPPSAMGAVPSTTTPITTPVTAPVGTSVPIVPGQTWCIARSGAAETALQSALDYACGIGGADCSTIQEGASCYNPNTLENHASYAFNSYFQKNPVATSCDFGGAAVVVNTNPSSGTCTYPYSATTAAPSTIPPATTAAPSTIPPATTASTSGATGTGSSYGSPPSTWGTSSGPIPGSSTAYGYGSPPIITAPPTGSAGVQPFLSFITLITSLAMTVLLVV